MYTMESLIKNILYKATTRDETMLHEELDERGQHTTLVPP